AVVLRNVERDRLGHGIGIAVDTPEVLGVVSFDRAAPAGTDRIDQHEICESKPGIRVVVQARARGVTAVRSKIENARPDKAEMQKSRGRARPAVKYKSERAVLRAVLQNIGCIENRCALLA